MAEPGSGGHGQDQAGSGGHGQDQAGPEQAGPEQAGQEQTGPEQAGPEQSGLDWAARVGQRVVVRHRTADGRATDAVGELLAVHSVAGPARRPELLVRTPRGEVGIPLDAVLAGKVVPPRPSRPGPPHRALSLAALERVTAQHWVAAEREPMGEWLLRASGGVTGRANSVLVQGDPGLPLGEALAAVRGWYATRGLPALASLAVPADAAFPVTGPPPDPELLDLLLAPRSSRARAPAPVDARAQLELRAELDRLGWGPGTGVSAYTLTAATAELVPRGVPPALPAGLALDLAPEPDAGWLARYRPQARSAPVPTRALLLSAPEQVFASIRSTAGGAAGTVAIARASFAAGWVGVGAVEVVPGQRRRGLARFLLAEIAQWAWERAARSTFLQVAVANPAAQRLYLSAGFTVHHRYDYLGPPQ